MKLQPCWRSLALVSVAIVLLAVSAASAKTAIVYTNDRETPYRGEFVNETADRFIIRSKSGINIPIPKNKIRKIEWELTLTEQYEQKRKAIADDDGAGRYKLARWAYDQNTAEGDALAKRELESLMLTQPDHKPAKTLHGLVVARVEKRKADQLNAQDNDHNRPKPDPPANGDKPDKPKAPATLDREQCNTLKVYVLEVDSRPPPRLSIAPKVLEEFYEQYRANPALSEYGGRAGKNRFKNLKAHEQLMLMFDAKARDYYGKVIVRNEPAPLREYRTKWQRVLVLSNLRHFPEQTKGVYLLTDKAKATTEAYAYTNLLMLHRATHDGQKFIDPEQPRQSLLLQWALPRDDADFPAPEAARWRPIFRGKDDPRVGEFVAWVESFYAFGTSFPIEFAPPKPEDATEAEPQAEGEQPKTPAQTPQPAG